MKLSDAIRLGAMLKPQAVRSWNGCALGVAMNAAGVEMPHSAELFRLWPWLSGVVLAEHPVTGERRSIVSIIYNLNDARLWSRERIANWVATIEPAEQSLDFVPDVTVSSVHIQTPQEATP